MEDLWRVVNSIGQTLFVEGHELRPSASAGCVVRDTPTTAEMLLQDASLALHRAKTYGGARVALFDPSLRQAASMRLELEADLRQAVANDELWIALQPIVSLPSATPSAPRRSSDGTATAPPYRPESSSASLKTSA